MLVQGIAAVDAVVVFIGAGEDHIPRRHRIQPVLHHKIHIAGQIDVDLAFRVHMVLPDIFLRLGIQLTVGDLHPKGMNDIKGRSSASVHGQNLLNGSCMVIIAYFLPICL